MSAQLAAHAAPRNRFTAHLVLAAGVDAVIHAPTLADLQLVVAKLEGVQPANDAGNSSAPARGAAPSPAPTAAPTAAPKQTDAAPSPTAAPAAVASQASTAAGEAGNAGAAASSAPAAAAASPASSSEAAESRAVSFDELKKAFLALSTKPDGRSKCEGVLKPLGLAKLSEAKPEQYAGLLDAINKAAA